MTIGIPEEYRVEGMPAVIDDLWQQGIAWLESAGARVREVSLPHTRFALPAYYIIAPAEASSNLARYDGVRYGLRCEGDDLVSMYERTRAEGFGDEVKRRILIGTYVLSEGYFDAYYLKAQKVRTRIADDFREAWTSVDALLTPTTPSAAFAADSPPDDPVSMYLNDVFTVPASLAGLPGISVPAGLDGDGLPLGLQVIARPFDEACLLKVARTIEEAAAFDTAPSGPVIVMVELVERGERALFLRHRARGPRADRLLVEALFRSLHRIRRCRQRPGLGRRCRHAGDAPRHQHEPCIEQAVRTGLALGGTINRRSVFERKNYFYPDLPQATRSRSTSSRSSRAGHVVIELEDGATRVHRHRTPACGTGCRQESARQGSCPLAGRSQSFRHRTDGDCFPSGTGVA